MAFTEKSRRPGDETGMRVRVGSKVVVLLKLKVFRGSHSQLEGHSRGQFMS